MPYFDFFHSGEAPLPSDAIDRLVKVVKIKLPVIKPLAVVPK